MSDGHMAGVDVAGRGPAIGPLVVCGVVFSAEGLETLLGMGVRDLKKLSHVHTFCRWTSNLVPPSSES